jgi:hypothetical protein
MMAKPDGVTIGTKINSAIGAHNSKVQAKTVKDKKYIKRSVYKCGLLATHYSLVQ